VHAPAQDARGRVRGLEFRVTGLCADVLSYDVAA